MDLWGYVTEILGSIEGLDEITSEIELRRKLKNKFGWGKHKDVGIFDPKSKGECVRLLLVPCSRRNFYERAFDVIDIARVCNRGPGVRLEGIMFLPVSWSQSLEQRLATYVSNMLRKYGVVQTCVKFPLSEFPRCWH